MNKPPYIDVTDEDVEAHMRPHLAHYMKFVVKRHVIPEKCVETSSKDKGKKGPEEDSPLSIDETKFLQSIVEHPFLPVTRRTDLLGLTSYRNNEIKKRLLSRKAISQYKINFGKLTCGDVKFVELTKQGYKTLGMIPPHDDTPFSVSTEHYWWQKAIAYYGKRDGYKTVIEMALSNDKKVDVVRMKENSKGRIEKFGYEVEMTAKNTAANCKGDLETNELTKLTFACKNKTVQKSVQQKLEQVLSDQQWELVDVMLLHEFKFVKEIINGMKT